ncbi:hypothetical protein S40288_04741 [Stachybotrys chartarum IBT 40288]|nr:hypothetical protein S40288_04741 [Stachybotrys chartarum IBT 40288]
MSLSRPPVRLLGLTRCSKCRYRWSVHRRGFATATRAETVNSQDRTPDTAASTRDAPRNPGASTGQLKQGKGLRVDLGLRGLQGNAGNKERQGEPRLILGHSTDAPIRARFAPSPTGYLHLGSLRTALFNKLAASASKNGSFILRIEDTDQTRLVQDAEQRLLEDLKWAGLSWDEGPDCGGPYGPYRQSERLPTYHAHAQELIDHGHAYRCFCSPEKLDAEKAILHQQGQPTVYQGTCRDISESESTRRAASGESHVVRLRSYKFDKAVHRDPVYGVFQNKYGEDDFILVKRDGFPTYHFANVVDDHLMKVTHVIRGEEWLISTPKHLLLYRAFGWTPPTFAHLGLLVHPDGNKLSKRNDSANLSKYQADGIFPMALLTWLANLGSSFKPKTPVLRTIQAMADAFTFKFTRGGIKLNFEKLSHFQKKYLQDLAESPNLESPEQESETLDKIIVQPLLRDIERITTHQDSAAEWVSEAWRAPLEPVPALVDEGRKEQYIFKMLYRGVRGLDARDALIREHPYLFWRVPTELYKSSLADAAPDHRHVVAISEATADPALWEGDGTQVMEFVLEKVEAAGANRQLAHDTIRLIGAGSPNQVSQNSPRLFHILGRDEWVYRLGIVQGLIGELER